MSRRHVAMLAGAAIIAATTAAAFAQETTTYSYDALGRLTSSSISGGPNDARKTGTCFDAAGNRTRYDMAMTTPAACPTPTPTPSPSP